MLFLCAVMETDHFLFIISINPIIVYDISRVSAHFSHMRIMRTHMRNIYTVSSAYAIVFRGNYITQCEITRYDTRSVFLAIWQNHSLDIHLYNRPLPSHPRSVHPVTPAATWTWCNLLNSNFLEYFFPFLWPSIRNKLLILHLSTYLSEK